jgi:hypothetical protein
MHTRQRVTRPVVPALRHATAAIAWIDARHALIVRTAADRQVEFREIEAAPDPVGVRSPYLAQVAHELGDRDRIVVLGPGTQRLDLERQLVGIYHHPDRIVDVDESDTIDRDGLVARLHELTGD